MNAEIDYRTKQSTALYNIVAELQPKGAGSSAGGATAEAGSPAPTC